jgi:hypothetical protein
MDVLGKDGHVTSGVKLYVHGSTAAVANVTRVETDTEYDSMHVDNEADDVRIPTTSKERSSQGSDQQLSCSGL